MYHIKTNPQDNLPAQEDLWKCTEDTGTERNSEICILSCKYYLYYCTGYCLIKFLNLDWSVDKGDYCLLLIMDGESLSLIVSKSF